MESSLPARPPSDPVSRADALAMLKTGRVKEWNALRLAHPAWAPELSSRAKPIDLARAELAQVDFRGAGLHGADLRGANLTAANLAGANVSEAKLQGATLSGASLQGVNLIAADLTGAFLGLADLSEAALMGANLTGARLMAANLSGANLQSAHLADAEVTIVTYDRRRLRGKCQGVNASGCYGNALFRRDLEDQDYLDTLEASLRRRRHRVLFNLWAMIDYGRSAKRVAMGAALLTLLFGAIYWFDWWFGWGLLDYTDSANSFLTPLYYSVVTYSTLGFGDVTPAHWIGELLVMAEVVLGYMTLGLLLTIVANSVARRS